jgi:hypothetical protein
MPTHDYKLADPRKNLGNMTYYTDPFPLVVLLIPRQVPNNALSQIFFENLTCGTIFMH